MNHAKEKGGRSGKRKGRKRQVSKRNEPSRGKTNIQPDYKKGLRPASRLNRSFRDVGEGDWGEKEAITPLFGKLVREKKQFPGPKKKKKTKKRKEKIEKEKGDGIKSIIPIRN